MLLSDLFSEIHASITTNKIRSGLTILGIVIGIASVIVMIAIGQGAQNSIEESIQSMGSNLLMVRPGAQRTFGAGPRSGGGSAESLTLEDVESIKGLEFVTAVAPEVSSNYQVIAAGENTQTSVYGISSEYFAVKNIEVAEGTSFTERNDLDKSRLAVIGPETSETLFGVDISPIGEKIRINGAEFTIIGMTKEKGSSGMGGSQDDRIYVPMSTAQHFLMGNYYLSMINVKVDSQDNMESAEEDLSALLLAKHKIENEDDADFSIMNQADMVETASSVTGTFTALLGAVAGISLLVGGIGIMNMMLTTVTERTREIGLRKAIGAKSSDINFQFFMESLTLTLIGGILGVFLGFIISFILNNFVGYEADIAYSSVVLAFGVSAVIGVVFGYYPAQKASKLNPIEALRFE